MSSQVQELIGGVKAGRWLLPSPDKPNPVSLARAIAGVCGSPKIWRDPIANELRLLIGEPEHLVFVIADGFGMNFVNTLSEDSVIRQNIAVEGRAAFPPITGANLFALSRGEWPGQHGVIGWFVFLEELGERATLFPWIRTRDGKDLTELGLTPEIVYPGNALVAGYARDSSSLIPNEIATSNPSRALHANTAVGYSDLADAIDQTIDHVQSSSSSYSHIYWKNVDRAAHAFGSSSTETLSQLLTLDSELNRLRTTLPPDVRIVVTGDHGHSDIPCDLKFVIGVDDELQLFFEATPSGDNRTQIFRVLEHKRSEFADKFRDRFADHFFLFSSKEASNLQLLGPDGISEQTMRRLGDFIAIAKGRAVMKVLTPENQGPICEQSEHGGFSADEMLVAIVIA
ncbi:MAG: alkaline phosphatase family protein [Chloroflexi bacterium]|nr:alkaline phosphatase family protein [Chloroflexota bacterium]